jgi:hypothetical protein
MTKSICQYCGWEIPSPQWWNNWNNEIICDDCDMDMIMLRQRQEQNAL